MKTSSNLEGFLKLLFNSDLNATGWMLQGTEELRTEVHIYCYCHQARFGKQSWELKITLRTLWFCFSGFISGKPGVRLVCSIQWYVFLPVSDISTFLSQLRPESHLHTLLLPLQSVSPTKSSTRSANGQQVIVMKLRGSRKGGKNVFNDLYFWKYAFSELCPWKFGKERLVNGSAAEGRVSYRPVSDSKAVFYMECHH